MATSPDLVRFVTGRLGQRFEARAMFGEYALYADGRVVALLCDDRLFVKVHETTAPLQGSELAPPYPGAKPHYVVEEGQVDAGLARLLLRLAEALPPTKPKPKARTAKGRKA
jgi:TfoX/Sxy family transcriptional regulator of competence genes